MRSLISTNSRPYRHLGGVALHNRALRIISEKGKEVEDQPALRSSRIDRVIQTLRLVPIQHVD